MNQRTKRLVWVWLVAEIIVIAGLSAWTFSVFVSWSNAERAGSIRTLSSLMHEQETLHGEFGRGHVSPAFYQAENNHITEEALSTLNKL